MTIRSVYSALILSVFTAISLGSCEHKPFPVPAPPEVDSFGNFPPEVGRIIIKKCAEGCHDPANYTANAGLLMDTWDHLFDGGNNGAVVVPYSPDYSSLMYFINTDPNRGIALQPTMPYNLNPPYDRPPLSDEEYNTIKSWIAKGAPDKFGNIPFSSNAATRQKVYMTMQGCGLLGVIDAERNVIMRYLKITGSIDDYAPHAVRTSPDGQYAFVCFSQNGKNLLKVNTTTDQIEARIPLLAGTGWNAFHVSQDGSKVILSNSMSNGSLAIVTTIPPFQYIPVKEGLAIPHGITSNKAFDAFYATLQYGNVVLKIYNEGANIDTLTLDGNPPFQRDTSTSQAIAPDPHEILMTPDDSKLFVTCQGTHEVKVIDAATFKVIRTINVGAFPQEMSVSSKYPYVYVTCMEAESYINPKYKGSVWIINYNTLAVVGQISGKFAQPHGIAIDDRNGRIYVGSRNANPSGPAPHHVSDCGTGRNGFFQAYDINTLQPVSVKHETTPDPYGCDVRFKN